MCSIGSGKPETKFPSLDLSVILSTLLPPKSYYTETPDFIYCTLFLLAFHFLGFLNVFSLTVTCLVIL